MTNEHPVFAADILYGTDTEHALCHIPSARATRSPSSSYARSGTPTDRCLPR